MSYSTPCLRAPSTSVLKPPKALKLLGCFPLSTMFGLFSTPLVALLR